MICEFCNKSLVKHQSRFCSLGCQSAKRWQDAKAFFIQNGFWKGIANPIAIARKYRKFLLETTPNLCAICKNSKWNEQPIPLVVDHIDGHSENWDRSNLRLICGNCDMQLPTFKNKNKGNGRRYRRKRYTDGKSW